MPVGDGKNMLIYKWLVLPWRQDVMTGNTSEEGDFLLRHVAAIVLHAVADDEVGNLQYHVVESYLVEGLLA